jgi:hypothetical protein
LAVPGELEFCKTKVVELKSRKSLLEKQIKKLEKQLYAQEHIYLAEMRRMRKTVTLDAISDTLSIIPFQSSLEKLARGGKLTNANKDKLLKLIAALETSFQAALAADAKDDQQRKFDKTIDACNQLQKFLYEFSGSVAPEAIEALKDLSDFIAAVLKALNHEANASGSVDLKEIARRADDLMEAVSSFCKQIALPRTVINLGGNLLVYYHVGRSADTIEEACSRIRIAASVLQRRIAEYNKLINFYELRIQSLERR